MRVATRRALLSRRAAAAPVGPGTGFISTWKTDNAGASNDDQIIIPVYNGGTYDCTVYWGDGTSDVISTWNDAAWTHTYATADIYTVEIVGQCEGFRFNNGGDKTKILTVEQFGADFRLGNLGNYFFGCTNLTSLANDLITTGMTNFFLAWTLCFGLTSFPQLDTSSITNLSNAWNGCSGLVSFPLLDTGSVTNFANAWESCTGLTSFPALNTSSGGIFGAAWRNCTGLTSFPAINTSLGTSFNNTWDGCTGLITFPALDMALGTSFTNSWRGCSNIASFLASGMNANFALPCDLDAAALNVVYGNLTDRSATTSRDINVTGNPGVGADDPSIATAKNWTVTGS